MARNVDVEGDPMPTSAVLMASWKHINTRCRSQKLAFLKCKKDDPNPEKCLEKGRQATRCGLTLTPSAPKLQLYSALNHLPT